MMETGEIIYEKVYESPRLPPKISFKDNWMKELGSEVAGGTGDSQQIQPKSKTQISITERPVSEQTPGLLTKEIETDVLFGCESTNSRTERPVKSCVPVSVECVDEDKDVDENVDADQTRTERPVGGQQSSLFTQLEEIDIDFRVSGLPHAVVKQAENFSVQELVKKIESHSHREALQTDFVNTLPPNTEKWLRKFYMKTMATVKSYESKCATNYSIITKQQLEQRVQQAAHQARHQ